MVHRLLMLQSGHAGSRSSKPKGHGLHQSDLTAGHKTYGKADADALKPGSRKESDAARSPESGRDMSSRGVQSSVAVAEITQQLQALQGVKVPQVHESRREVLQEER